MKKASRFGFWLAATFVVMPMTSFAGVVVAGPEIDPASAVGGLAMVMTTAALIIERRRRR